MALRSDFYKNVKSGIKFKKINTNIYKFKQVYYFKIVFNIWNVFHGDFSHRDGFVGLFQLKYFMDLIDIFLNFSVSLCFLHPHTPMKLVGKGIVLSDQLRDYIPLIAIERCTRGSMVLKGLGNETIKLKVGNETEYCFSIPNFFL